MVLLVTIVHLFSLFHCWNMQLIHSTVEKHLSYFQFWAVNILLHIFCRRNMRFLMDIYLGIELMGCRICTYSVFVDTAKQFSKVAMLYLFLQQCGRVPLASQTFSVVFLLVILANM